MNFFLRSASYIFHPLFLPLVAVLIYFIITPRYIELDIVSAQVLATAILTLIIPLITFFLLRNLGVVQTIHLREVKERKMPLMLQCALLLLIIKMVYDPYDSPELYYFFVGVLFSALSALILSMLNFKASLHQIGISGITIFTVALSVHFQINMLWAIAVLLFVNGWVATSRLHSQAHSFSEITVGFFVGIVPQFIVLPFWL